MNRREAKREACGIVAATIANWKAEGAELYQQDESADSARLRDALDELAEELFARARGRR